MLLARNATFHMGTAKLHLLQHHHLTITANHNAQNILTTTQHQAMHLASGLQRQQTRLLPSTGQQSLPLDISTCV